MRFSSSQMKTPWNKSNHQINRSSFQLKSEYDMRNYVLDGKILEWESLFHRIGPDEDVEKYKFCTKAECAWVRETLLDLNRRILDLELKLSESTGVPDNWKYVEIIDPGGEVLLSLKRSPGVFGIIRTLLGTLWKPYEHDDASVVFFDENGVAISSLTTPRFVEVALSDGTHE